MNYNKKIKWISFLMTAAILLSGLNFGIWASTETGYEVSLSNSVTPIGGEVVLTVALTNYSAQSDGIRGLQIDITNVDDSVLEVVSSRSLITDPTAASNTPSYSKPNSRVRLVYANFYGTLPVSNEADGKMAVFEVKFKINQALEESGQIELPITVKLQTTSGTLTLKSSCSIVYGAHDNPVNSVNISWNSMQFTYTEGAWNAGTHEYGEGEWIAEDNGGQITLENVGNRTISALFAYSPNQEYDNIRGTFLIGNDSVSELNIAVNEEKTVSFRLSGKPQSSISDIVLGTITVTIGQSE